MDPFNPNAPSAEPTNTTARSVRGNAPRRVSVGDLVGILFLASQTIFVLQSHFFAESARLLTPVEGLTHYELYATAAQRPLTASEIRERYGIPFRDDVPLTVGAVRAAVIQRETRNPEPGAVYVRLRTREPDGTEDYWLWPQE
jgi:hypothetical protein